MQPRFCVTMASIFTVFVVLNVFVTRTASFNAFGTQYMLVSPFFSGHDAVMNTLTPSANTTLRIDAVVDVIEVEDTKSQATLWAL
jgi:hypothetical protein